MTERLYYECRWCLMPAFDLVSRPVSGAPLRSSDARHLDGSPIAKGSPTLCDSCGKQVAEPSWPFSTTLYTFRIKAYQA